MITGYCLCRNLIKAIANYAPLQDYSANKFGKQPKFYYAVDETDPPSKDDAPFIALWQDIIDFSEPATIIRPLNVGCVVLDAGTESDDYIDKAYKGFDTIENFERLVFAAIECYADESEIDVSIIDSGEARFKHYYPYFHSVRAMKFVTIRS